MGCVIADEYPEKQVRTVVATEEGQSATSWIACIEKISKWRQGNWICSQPS
jgi:hypothetical protein